MKNRTVYDISFWHTHLRIICWWCGVCALCAGILLMITYGRRLEHLWGYPCIVTMILRKCRCTRPVRWQGVIIFLNTWWHLFCLFIMQKCYVNYSVFLTFWKQKCWLYFVHVVVSSKCQISVVAFITVISWCNCEKKMLYITLGFPKHKYYFIVSS